MIDLVEADLASPAHRDAVLELTRSYARDPMGSGADLPQPVQGELVERLRAHPTTLVFLAFQGCEPAGIATCFLGFSTFAARPLVNVHDLHVAPRFQRRGTGRRLLEAVEARARALDCCKLTLEVQAGNHRARALYRSFGFADGQAAPAAGAVLFLEKRLAVPQPA
jgi:ribosomal protein S18 acetylase RimI-like enzyme